MARLSRCTRALLLGTTLIGAGALVPVAAISGEAPSAAAPSEERGEERIQLAQFDPNERPEPQQEEDRRRSDLLEEIVVTTTKREAGAQSLGIALTAFTGDQLESLGVDNAGEVEEITPNMSLDRPYAAKGFNTQITIRGIGQPDFGDNTESTVTSYVDGFYLISQGTQDFLLHDIQRVEVARGPQGTVQGRNSTAGSINYIVNEPERNFGASLKGTLGRFDLAEVEAVLNVPLGEAWAVRFSGAFQQNDGFERNINPERLFDLQGENEFVAVRGIASYEPNDRFRASFTAAYGDMGPAAAQNEQSLQIRVSDDGTQTVEAETDAFGNNEENVGAGSKEVVNQIGPNFIGNEILHFNVNAEWDVTDQLTLTALGGWMESQKISGEDCDDGPLNVCLFSNDADQDHWMVETRANWTADSGRLRLVGGFNYLEQTIDSTAVTPLFFDPELSVAAGLGGDLLSLVFNDQQDLESWAIFAEAEYDLTNQFTFVAGLRFTHDRKEFDAFFAQNLLPPPIPIPRTLGDFLALGDQIRASNPATTIFNRETAGDLAVIDEGFINANIQLNWTPNDDILAYIAYRRGVKSGGFITGNVGPGFPAEQRPYGEETNNAYEIGLKSTLMDGLLRLNTAAFFYDYNNLQSNSFIGITNVITNNDTIAYGGEVELTASPLVGLDVSFALGLLDSEVQDVTNAQGVTEDRELPLAPNWTINGAVRYEWPAFLDFGGDFWVQGSTRAQGARWRDALNNPSVELESFVRVDSQIGYKTYDGRYAVYFWVENLLDNRYETTTVDLSSLGGTGEVAFHPPRWWGFTVAFEY